MQHFNSLVGQTIAKETLTKMLKLARVPGTLLFSGPRGVGKSHFALQFAALLMGPAHTQKVLAKSHPDLHVYEASEKSGLHPISSVHSLLEEIHLSPMEAPVKVFIIEDAEKMLASSSNALLKILEEPPKDSVIILVSHESERLLPTIRSRCRRIAFFPIAEQEMINYLMERCALTQSQACSLAKRSQGSLGKALFYAKQQKDPKQDLLQEILSQKKYLNYPKLQEALLELEGLAEDEEDTMGGYDLILEEIVTWQRDLILLQEKADAVHLFHSDHLKNLEDGSHEPAICLEKVLKKVADCRYALEHNVKLRTALEHLFLNL